MNKSFLIHSGVLGMRWGHRKTSSSSSSKDHQTAHSLKGKKLEDMSNEELKTLVSRLQLERQFKEARKQDSSSGKKFVTEIMANAGKQVAAKYVAELMTNGVEKLRKAAKKS